MGDRTNVYMYLYGRCPPEAVRELAEAMAAESATSNSEAEWQSGSAIECAAALNAWTTNSPFALYGEDVNYGSMESIEDTCRAHDICFIASWEAGDGYEAGKKLFIPGEGETECGVADGEPGARLSDLKRIAEQGIGAVRAYIASLERFTGVGLPPFRVAGVLEHMVIRLEDAADAP